MRSVSLVLLTVFLFTIAPACRKSASATVFVDPALATLVPADTMLLAGVRMEQLAKTRFWQDYIKTKRVTMVEDFRKRTGLDPAKDLWEILMTSNGKPDGTLVLIRGKFADMGMEPKLDLPGAQRMSWKGFTMIGDAKNAVLFLNPSTAAAGPTDALHRLVDNRNNISGLPPELDERIKKIPSTNQAWFVAKVEGRIPELGGPASGGGGNGNASASMGMLSNLARLAQSLRFATGALDLREEFHANIDLQATSDQQADRLGGAIRALLGLGRLSTGEKQREVLSVYDGMRVTKEADVVHFVAGIPYPVLEKAAAELPMLGVK